MPAGHFYLPPPSFYSSRKIHLPSPPGFYSACRKLLSSSAFILQCPKDISFLFRLHSTVPAGHFFPSPPSFYSARWTFLSSSAFILQCPLDISFLFSLHSTVPAGHFFPLPSLQCPQDISFPTRLILLYSARKKTKAFNSDTSKVIYVLFITFHVPVIL